MINTLHIKNIGIIDDITINLNEGFNVLTGETGAGKTLIIGSLQILAGGRFSKDMIRSGQNHSFVEMSVNLPNLGYEEDTVIVSREINLKGKNICKINGRLVTVSELKNFMSKIIDIHGQNDNQSLLDISTHIQLLDNYSHEEIDIVKQKYSELYEEYRKIREELNKNYGDDKEKQRKLDLLNYQITEIEEANLKIGEEERLEEKRKQILFSEKIVNNLQEAENQLKQNVIDSMSIAVKSLEKIEEYDKKYTDILTRLKESYYEVQEICRDIDDSNNDIYFEEDELLKVEDRLDVIYSLKRKYGNSIIEILQYKQEIQKEIFEIENLEEYIKSLKNKQKQLEEQMMELCKKMNIIRQKFSKILSEEINKQLQELEMKNSKFNVKIEFSKEYIFNNNGLDTIEFMISTNTGEEEKSLVKVASGGEMSRIMLAIKYVLAEIDKVPVLIFDEIDTGISGVAANTTGEKIKEISKSHQVICVTHLASIAAKGDFNYYISKDVKNEKTYTKIELLDEKSTLREIARIASGTITEISLKHARELRYKNKKEIA